MAKNEITDVKKKVVGLPAPRITVLLSDKNQYYTALNDIDGFICEELRKKKRHQDRSNAYHMERWMYGCALNQIPQGAC